MMVTKRTKRTRILAVLFIVSLIFAFGLSIEKAKAVEKVSLATATTGGTWYPTGGLWANLCNKKISEINITAEVTSGSGENAKLMDKKRLSSVILTA